MNIEAQLLSIVGDAVRSLPLTAFALYLWWKRERQLELLQAKYEAVLLKIAKLPVEES